jgi:hypothetical protein
VVNGQNLPITDAELPRDDWSDIRRTVTLETGANDIEIRAAQQLEVLRLTAYSLTLADIPTDWSVAYDDAYYVVMSPASRTAASGHSPEPIEATNQMGVVPDLLTTDRPS